MADQRIQSEVLIMLHRQYFLFSLILFFSCSANTEKAADAEQKINPDTVTESMPQDGTIVTDSTPVLPDTLMAENLLTEAKTYEFQAVYTTPYCGGAAPPEEILKENAIPKPLKNSLVMIRKSGELKGEIKIKTNNLGVFKYALEPGTYNYYLTKEFDPSITIINKNCTKVFLKSYGSFTIKKTSKGSVVLSYAISCDPCDENMKKRPAAKKE